MAAGKNTGKGWPRLRWLVLGISALWAGTMLYRFYFAADPDQYGFKSPEVAERMESCAGTFRERYDCKEAAIIEKGHEDFVAWMGQMALILGPPGMLWATAGLLSRRRRQSPVPGEQVLVRRGPVPISRYRVW